MFGFGFEGYLLAGLSRRIGAYRATIWFQIAVVLMLCLLAIFLFTPASFTPLTILVILLTGAIGAIGIFSFSHGLEHGHISVVATVASAWGAVTAILSILFFGDKLTALQSLCIALIVIGTVLICIKPKHLFASFSPRTVAGLKYAFVTLFAWGIFYFLLTYLVKNIGWFDAGVLVTVPGVILLLIFGWATKIKLKTSKLAVPLVILIAVLNIIASLAYNLGVTYNYSSVVAPVSAASPIVIITMALLFFKERLAHHQKIGIALVLIGLVALAAL
jgi:drug/metabolite transporter (DMT)-like permease